MWMKGKGLSAKSLTWKKEKVPSFLCLKRLRPASRLFPRASGSKTAQKKKVAGDLSHAA